MTKRAIAVCGGVGATLVALVWLVTQTPLIHAGTKVRVGQPCANPNRPSLAEVDHAPFDALLLKYVDDHGMVAYAKWKGYAEDVEALDADLARLGCVDLSKSASQEAKLAFWINAYNAVTIKGILREYPTTSIRKHTAALGYNIWKDLLLWVDGKNCSLDDIEHATLRKMGEPRIHFAVVCASKGCPLLWNRAYTAGGLDEQLAANARRFFARPENFRADAGRGRASISQLLKWYGTDFAATPQAQLSALRKYFPNPESHTWMDSGRASVGYLDYDWALNDQAPPSR